MKSVVKPSEISSSLINCELGRIVGLHAVIQAIWDELEVPLFGVPKIAASSYPGLLRTLSRTPLQVTRERQQLYCIGNVRAFIMAHALLPSDSMISCIEHSADSAENIRENFLTEFIYQPAIFGVQKAGIKTISHVARLAFARGYLPRPSTSVETHISTLFNVDRRKLVPVPMATWEEINEANSFWNESALAPEEGFD